jgi:hypothetical protein
MGENLVSVWARYAWCCALTAGLGAQTALERGNEQVRLLMQPGALEPALASRLADAALVAATSAWAPVQALWAPKLTSPIELQLHADAPTFRALEQKAGITVPDELWFDPATGVVHVLLLAGLSPQARSMVGLGSTESVLVRAAVLGFAAKSSPLVVADPWLGEVLGWAVLEANSNPKHAYGLDPGYDTRRLPLWRAHAEGKFDELKSKVMDFAVATTVEQQATLWADQCVMARTMAATGKDWAKKLLGKPPKKVPPRGEVRAAAVERVFGSDWRKSDALYQRLHANCAPRWQLLAPMATVRDGRLQCVGGTTTSMQFQANELPPPGDYTIRGSFELQPCGDDACRIQLDWDGTSMIGCFFGIGSWRIERWQSGGDWQPLANGKAPIVRGKPFEAAVAVGKVVRLLVDGSEVGSWDCSQRTMRGRWSFGVSDCVVFVDQLRLLPGLR